MPPTYFFIFQRTVIALGQFSITDEREKYFRFSSTFGYIQTTFIVRKRGVAQFYMQFARPFAHGVWYMIMLVMVLSAFYVCLLDAWNPFKDEIEAELRYDQKESIWYSFLTIFQVGAPFGAYMIPMRVYSVFYWFFAMVVVSNIIFGCLFHPVKAMIHMVWCLLPSEV